jgi:WD40 repeat protein
VLLYELLVGQTPFSAKEMMEGGLDALRRIIREREPQRPSTTLNTLAGDARTTAGKRRQTAVDQLVHQLQGDLDWIVMKCLEKDRVRRYDTANGLAADVQRYLANEPVVARPPSAGYRFTKTFQRNKLAFAAAGAIALALIAGITVSTWQAVRATRARQAAEQAQAAELAQKRLALDKQQEAESAQQRAEASEKRASDLLYSAKLNLAQVAYEQSNFGRVHELLEDTRDHPKRSFEWHYWQRQLHGESRILRGISGEVYRVAFSPDATRVAAHGLTHLIVWDAASGRELLNIPAPHPNFGDRFHYSSKVTFSPDGKQILMLAQDGLEVRDAFTGTSLFRLKGASAGNYAPDGRVIASVIALGPEPCIALWDAKTGDRMHTFRRVASDQETLRSARFTSDGRALLLSTTGGVSLLDATTGELIRVIIDTPMWDYPTVYLSHDGTRMLESDRFGGNGFVLDATKPQGQPEEFPGFGGIVSAEFSPDDRWLVATSRDRTARIIDLNTRNVIRSLKGHWGELHDVALSRDGRWVATASADGTVRIWDWETRQNPHLVGMKVGGLLSPDERLLLEMTLEGATLREFATGKVLREFFLHPSNDYIGTWAAGFSPDGTRVVTGSYQGTADVFDVATGARVFNLFTNATPRGVVYSPDGTKILTASKGGARTWDANTGRPLLLFSVGDSEMSPAIFSPNGRQVATTADPTGTQIWDAETGSLLRTLEPGGRDWNATEALAYSPDGRHLALGQSDGLVTIWNVTTGDKVVTLSGHTKGITSVQYSADGKRILTASVDKSARLWDAETGNELLALKGHETQVNSATFLADGRRILTSGWGQTLLWEAATPEASAAWGREQREAQENLKRRRAAADAEAKAAREARARELAALAGASESAPQHKPSTKGRPPIPGDPGAIRQWLVLGPLPFEGDAVLNVLRQQLPNEARLRPRAGVRPPQVPAGLGWTPVRLGEDSYQLNFVEWVQGAKPKADTDNQVAYAVAYIVSKTPQTGLLLLSGSDDTARVYLNEKEIYRQLNPRAWQADQDEVSGVELKAGLNVLVFKVANGIGGWAGSVRFTTADGGPVHGITVTLDPDASP